MSQWVAMQAPYTLTANTQYSAHIHLSFAEKLVATEAMVVSKFTDAGFTNVTCSLNGSEGTVCGTWPGDTQVVKLPSEVTEVWVWQ